MSSLYSASICIIVKGSARTKGHGDLDLTQGSVLFIAADQTVDLVVSCDGLLLFRAYCSW